MVSMFEFIRDNQDTLKTDFVTWTGDNSAHDTWMNTQDEVVQYTQNITNSWRQIVGMDNDI